MKNIYAKYLTESSTSIVEYSSETLSNLRAFCVRKAEKFHLYVGDGDIGFSFNENKGILIVVFNVDKFDKAAEFISMEVEKEFGLKSNLNGNKLIIDLKQVS